MFNHKKTIKLRERFEESGIGNDYKMAPEFYKELMKSIHQIIPEKSESVPPTVSTDSLTRLPLRQDKWQEHLIFQQQEEEFKRSSNDNSIINNDTLARGDGIFSTLSEEFGNTVEVLNPNLATNKSLFDPNPDDAREAATYYAEPISGYTFEKNNKWEDGKGILDSNENRQLQKPIVAIVNTSHGIAKNDTDIDASGGFHWIAIVILPKNYKGKGNDTEEIYLIDSLNPNRDFPLALREFLVKGGVYQFGAPTNEKNPTLKIVKHHIKPAFPHARFMQLPNFRVQQLGGTDCGWWAVDNAIRIVGSGSADTLIQPNSPQRATALRRLYPNLDKDNSQHRPATTSRLVETRRAIQQDDKWEQEQEQEQAIQELTQFSERSRKPTPKINFIVVAHLVPSLPYFLEAVSSIGNIAMLIPKESNVPESVHAFLTSEKMYGSIISKDINKGSLKNYELKTKQALLASLRKRMYIDGIFIILDHGGYFAPCIINLLVDLPNILGVVEHTVNGDKEYEKILKQFPKDKFIISIARSFLKKFENDAVANSIVLAISSELYSAKGFNQEVERLERILIIGAGNIGGGVANKLISVNKVRKEKIFISDPSLDARNQASQIIPTENIIDPEKYPALKQELISKADLIVTASNNICLTKQDFLNMKNGVCVVCATSSDKQFDTDSLIGWDKIVSKQIKPYITYCHRRTGNKIHLAAGGGSVNFLIGSTPHPIIHAIFASVCINAFRLAQQYKLKPNIINQALIENDELILKYWNAIYKDPGVNEEERKLRLVKRMLYVMHENLKKLYQSKAWRKFENLDKKQQNIADSYFNLEIVSHPLNEHKSQEKSHTNKSLHHYIGRISSYEDTFTTKCRIALSALFLPNNKISHLNEKDDKPPTIVVIIGRAGIGKTILTRFLSDQWSQGNLWKDDVQVLFTIQLRNLLTSYYKHHPEHCTLANIIQHECFPDLSDREFTLLWNAIVQLPPSSIQFALDGYDEIASILPKIEDEKLDHPLHQVLQHLLTSQYRLLITTRPSGIHAIKVYAKRIVEVIGFTQENINNFVKHYFSDNEEVADRLLDQINKNPMMLCSAHVPLQLNLICAISVSNMQSLEDEAEPAKTMSRLYYYMDTELLFRSYQDLFKVKLAHINPLTLRSINAKREIIEAEPVYAACMWTLGYLALQGIQNNQIIFSYKQILVASEKAGQRFVWQTIQYGHNEAAALRERQSEIISLMEKTGYLKTAIDDAINDYKLYEFIHLTFQEYYAAYFLKLKLLSGNKADRIPAKQFILKFRYNPRLQIVWWFLAGALRNHLDTLNDVLSLFQKEPKDIIGQFKTLLLLRCIEESEQPYQVHSLGEPKTPCEKAWQQLLNYMKLYYCTGRDGMRVKNWENYLLLSPNLCQTFVELLEKLVVEQGSNMHWIRSKLIANLAICLSPTMIKEEFIKGIKKGSLVVCNILETIKNKKIANDLIKEILLILRSIKGELHDPAYHSIVQLACYSLSKLHNVDSTLEQVIIDFFNPSTNRLVLYTSNSDLYALLISICKKHKENMALLIQLFFYHLENMSHYRVNEIVDILIANNELPPVHFVTEILIMMRKLEATQLSYSIWTKSYYRRRETVELFDSLTKLLKVMQQHPLAQIIDLIKKVYDYSNPEEKYYFLRALGKIEWQSPEKIMEFLIIQTRDEKLQVRQGAFEAIINQKKSSNKLGFLKFLFELLLIQPDIFNINKLYQIKNQMELTPKFGKFEWKWILRPDKWYDAVDNISYYESAESLFNYRKTLERYYQQYFVYYKELPYGQANITSFTISLLEAIITSAEKDIPMIFNLLRFYLTNEHFHVRLAVVRAFGKMADRILSYDFHMIDTLFDNIEMTYKNRTFNQSPNFRMEVIKTLDQIAHAEPTTVIRIIAFFLQIVKIEKHTDVRGFIEHTIYNILKKNPDMTAVISFAECKEILSNVKAVYNITMQCIVLQILGTTRFLCHVENVDVTLNILFKTKNRELRWQSIVLLSRLAAYNATNKFKIIERIKNCVAQNNDQDGYKFINRLLINISKLLSSEDVQQLTPYLAHCLRIEDDETCKLLWRFLALACNLEPRIVNTLVHLIFPESVLKCYRVFDDDGLLEILTNAVKLNPDDIINRLIEILHEEDFSELLIALNPFIPDHLKIKLLPHLLHVTPLYETNMKCIAAYLPLTASKGTYELLTSLIPKLWEIIHENAIERITLESKLSPDDSFTINPADERAMAASELLGKVLHKVPQGWKYAKYFVVSFDYNTNRHIKDITAYVSVVDLINVYHELYSLPAIPLPQVVAVLPFLINKALADSVAITIQDDTVTCWNAHNEPEIIVLNQKGEIDLFNTIVKKLIPLVDNHPINNWFMNDARDKKSMDSLEENVVEQSYQKIINEELCKLPANIVRNKYIQPSPNASSVSHAHLVSRHSPLFTSPIIHPMGAVNTEDFKRNPQPAVLSLQLPATEMETKVLAQSGKIVLSLEESTDTDSHPKTGNACSRLRNICRIS